MKTDVSHRERFIDSPASGEALRLPDRLLIGSGSERSCYLHPTDPGLVVKVPLSGGDSPANHHEMKGYALLRKEGVDLSFISRCHGFTDTDRGLGLVCGCVRDADGAVSTTIWDTVLFQDDCDIGRVLELAESFCEYLITNRIWIFDINSKNIVLRKDAGGGVQPYIIDVKGRYANNELVPVARYFRYFSQKKLKRRSRQLLQRVDDLYRRREEIRLRHPFRQGRHQPQETMADCRH